VRSAQAGKERGVAKIGGDAESDEDDAEDDSRAKIELDERSEEVKANSRIKAPATGARRVRFWRRKDPTALAEAPKEIKTTEKPATKASAEANKPELGTSPLRSCSMPMPDSMEM